MVIADFAQEAQGDAVRTFDALTTGFRIVLVKHVLLR